MRPRVLLNFASSVDGKIGLVSGLRTGTFTMSRGREDRRRMRDLRATADAILIGAGNLRADDPDLALDADEHRRRRAAGEREPFRVVLTSRGDGVAPERRVFDSKRGGQAVVVHTDAMPALLREKLAPVAHLVSLGQRVVEIPKLLDWLSKEMGVRTLLCEGGGILVARLFAARAVDELHLTLVPRVLGGVDAPTLAEGPGFRPDEIPDGKLVSVDHVGDELFLRYAFTWA